MTKVDTLMLKVLESWTGTPEELGSDLYSATMPAMDREEQNQKRWAAARIMEYDGGKELIAAEIKFLKRKRPGKKNSVDNNFLANL